MGSVSVNPPKTPVTKGSNGVAAATIPNVCKMPGPPAPFVPAPLPNIGKSALSPKDYSTSVTFEGNAVAIRGSTFESIGDIASKGTGGGLISANTHGITKFIGPGSMDVQIEGKNVQLLSDPMLNNCGPGGSPPNAATLVGVLQATGLAALLGDEVCPICEKAHGDAGKLEETTDSKGEADKLKAAADRAVKKFRDALEDRIDKEFQAAKDRAKANYEAAVKAYDARVAAQKANMARVSEAVAAKIQASIDSMKKPTEAVVKREDIAARIGSGHIDAMLGVVVCAEKKVFAGQAGGQLAEIQEEMDASWHRAAVSKGKMAKDRLAQHIPSPVFETQWTSVSASNTRWETAVDKAEKTKAGRASAGEPFFPPGQCAAQQCFVLALDHGDRPAGLTERAYNSQYADYEVYAHARDTPSSAPQGRYFGGTKKDKAGDPEAVPPCGTCQVMLMMLMCPDVHPTKCGPAKKVSGCKGCG